MSKKEDRDDEAVRKVVEMVAGEVEKKAVVVKIGIVENV